MNRFDAQLTAIDLHFLSEVKKKPAINKIEVTDFDFIEDDDKWNVQYTVTYSDGTTVDCDEYVDNDYDSYCVDELNKLNDFSVILM